MDVERDIEERDDGSGEDPDDEGSVGGAEQDGGDVEGGETEEGPLFLTKTQLLENDTKLIGCQEKSTKGRFYKGNANTTVDGIPCQKWSESTPHNHSFTDMGDHNFCRNPHGEEETQVWCFTTDPEQERGNCSVPFCPPLKALDFSLDNDEEADKNGSYTKATIQKEDLPSSFTICTAFTVEATWLFLFSCFSSVAAILLPLRMA